MLHVSRVVGQVGWCRAASVFGAPALTIIGYHYHNLARGGIGSRQYYSNKQQPAYQNAALARNQDTTHAELQHQCYVISKALS